MNTGPRAILFDLDETLSDRSLSMEPYALRLQQDFGHALAPIETATIATSLKLADGNGYRSRAAFTSDIARLLPWQVAPAHEALSDHWEEWFPALTVARSGALELLAELKRRGIALGLISNGRARIQLPKLERLGVGPYLSTLIISESVGVEKPDSRIFALALAELGCAPAEAWYIGDHPFNDIIGARDAGLRPIWLRGIHPWPEEHAQPVDQIVGLGELLALLDACAG